MYLRLVRGDCDDGKTCPALHLTDRNSVVVQGRAVDSELVAELDLPAGTQVVEVPEALLAEVAGRWPALRQTERGTIIVPGIEVKDPEALRQLRLPADERAVEVPAANLAEILQTC